MPKEAEAPAKRARASRASTTTKRKKDPNAPKRPLTAYMHYAQEQREIVRTANPEASFGRVHTIIGENWKKLSADGKKPYEAKAATAKEKYEQEKAAYAKQNA